MKDPLYILDGYGIIYRSYFAFAGRHLTDPDGVNVSAVFGFFRTVFSIIRDRKITHFCVALDSLVPTFRHENFPEYKATRDKTPEELHHQIPIIEDMMEALGMASVRLDRFEADDLMGTLAARCEEEGRECFLISGDKDILQLVSETTRVLKPAKGGVQEMSTDEVFKDKGVQSHQIIDYLALIGDSSDNIPGVKGIGPKSAEKLLLSFGSLDGIYENLEKVTSASWKKKLEENRDNAYLSRDLATIKRDVPIPYTPESYILDLKDRTGARDLFLSRGLKSLISYLGGEASEAPVKKEAKKGSYTAVTNSAVLEDLERALVKAGIAAFDCETDGLDEMTANPVGFSFAVESGGGWYIPLKADKASCLEEELVKSFLIRVLQDNPIKIIGQNIKYDYKVLSRWGVNIKNIVFDTMIAAWLIDSSHPQNMDYLAEHYLNYRTVHFKDIVPKGKTFDSVPLDKAVEYAAEDADITFRLYETFLPLLEEKKLDKLFYSLEMPLVTMLARMELNGIILDRERMATLDREISRELVSLEDEIYILCGKEFNIKSTKQLQQVLFEERKLTPIKKTKTGYSTDTSVLTELAKEDPVPGKIVRYRAVSKLKSTYIDTLPSLINSETGRIHTHFMQNGTETGRLSSKNPNLQNIPIKEESGRQIRGAFVPAEGCEFISADYSQIELVVLAHLSGDEELSRAFKSGLDIHTQTASLIFHTGLEEVTSQQRRIAKTINFGVMYGMSAFRLSNELDIPRAEAESFIEAYFERFSGVKSFIADTVRSAESAGGVSTMRGRFRTLPGITSRNKMEKNGAARAAVNTRIQGSAADIVKQAMLDLQEYLSRNKSSARLLLQVHDEFILEVPSGDADTLSTGVVEVMENAIELSVPLRVNCERGKSWGDIH